VGKAATSATTLIVNYLTGYISATGKLQSATLSLMTMVLRALDTIVLGLLYQANQSVQKETLAIFPRQDSSRSLLVLFFSLSIKLKVVSRYALHAVSKSTLRRIWGKASNLLLSNITSVELWNVATYREGFCYPQEWFRQ
jgi:hypothetical protein